MSSLTARLIARAAVVLGCVSFASAQTPIFTDDFSGSSATALNGQAPDTRPGSEVWAANGVANADGSLDSTTAGSSWLPHTLQNDKIYTLTTTLNITYASGSVTPAGVAFTASPTVVANVLSSSTSQTYGILRVLRGGGWDFYPGPNDDVAVAASGAANSLFTGNQTNYEVKLVLTTSSTTNWKLEAYFGGVQVDLNPGDSGSQAYVFLTTPALTGAGLHYASSTFKFNSFSLVSAPVSTVVPLVFNATETAAPGETIYLQGDDFGATPQVWFRRVLSTDTAIVPTTQLTVQSQSNQAVKAVLPETMPMGLYAVWVKSTAGNFSAPVFLNRARAMSFEYGAVSPGYEFRIFGRNLFLPGSTPTVTFVNGANSYAASVVSAFDNNPYELKIQAPAGLVSGTTYTVYVSNGYGHNATANLDVTPSEETILGRTGGTDVFGLGVPWGADFAAIGADVINVVTSINPHTSAPYGADATGVVNARTIIQQVLTDAGNAAYHPNGATVYLPAGTYLINYATSPGLSIPSRVVLKGDGPASTFIVDSTPASSTALKAIVVATNATTAGITGFSYTQTATNVGFSPSTMSPPLVTMGTPNASKIFTDNVEITFAHSVDGNGGSYSFASDGMTNVLIQDSTFDYGMFGIAGNPNPGTAFHTIRNNHILHHAVRYRGRVEPGDADFLVFENNVCTRDGNWPAVVNGYIPYEQGGIECGFGAKHIILRNTFDAVNLPLTIANDGESILNQSEPQSYDFGQPTAVTSTTLTNASRTWVANEFAGDILAIVAGPGTGQWRTVTGNTGTVVTISAPWTKLPTTASTYALTGAGADRILVKDNFVLDQTRAITFWTGSYDSAVIGNFVRDCGQGVYLRSDQRNADPKGKRMNLTWRSVVADNVVLNTTGFRPGVIAAPTYCTNSIDGTLTIGPDYRRNVLEANVPNLRDGSIGLNDGYADYAKVPSFVENSPVTPGILATIFEDNVGINIDNAYAVNTATYQSSVVNALNLNCATVVSDTTLTGGSHASVSTVVANDYSFLDARFSGAGTSTGTTEMIESGGAGSLIAGTGGNTIAVHTTTPFVTGAGSYLRCVRVASGGTTGRLQVTPVTARTSWGRIFDLRSTQWLVNGGFDFFWRPAQTPSTANSMRPIDVANSVTNGLGVALYNNSATQLVLALTTPSGGGGVALTGTYSAGFAANQVYHIAVTWTTDPISGVTTQKIYAAPGTGAINTAVTTNLIGSTTFTLNAGTVTDTSGFLGTGTWLFGDTVTNGAARTNDYDGLRMYNQIPASFSFPGL